MKNRRFTMTVLLCILSLLFCALLSSLRFQSRKLSDRIPQSFSFCLRLL